MGMLLLLVAIGYLVVKNLKKETTEELKVFDGSLPENSPLALANMGAVENKQATAESLLKISMSTPISSVNPAVAPSLVIQSKAEEIIESLKAEPLLPILPLSIPQPGEICETIEVKNVIKVPVFSDVAYPVALGFIQTGQSVKVYVCGKTREERMKRAIQKTRELGYTVLLS